MKLVDVRNVRVVISGLLGRWLRIGRMRVASRELIARLEDKAEAYMFIAIVVLPARP